jgi:hypothetical protein
MKWMVAAAFVVTAPSSARAHEGWGIVVDAQGRVYVTDIPANTIWRISPDGSVEAVRRDTHSHALSLGPDGAVYGAHASFTAPVVQVWRLDARGQFTDVIPSTRGFPLGMQSFMRAPDGSVYSSNVFQYPEPPGGRSIYLLRSRAGVIDTIAGGKAGHADGPGPDAQFESIDGMAMLPDGSILLADGEWLRRVSADGEVSSIRKLTEKRWDQDLLGVAVGPGDVVYAADFAGRVVHRLTGTRADTLYSPGMFWAPTGVAATAQGVYVLEHLRAPLGILGDIGIGPYLRVRHIRSSSDVDTLAAIWGRNSWILLAFTGIVAGMVLLATRRRRHRRMERGSIDIVDSGA